MTVCGKVFKKGRGRKKEDELKETISNLVKTRTPVFNHLLMKHQACDS